MKIFDCFTFYNEFDLLEIRLNETKGAFDYHVICEADHTFSNKPKEFLLENWKYYNDFKEKIIYLKFKSNLRSIPMQNEHEQRNFLITAIDPFINEKNIVVLSDLDEIPNVNNFNFRNINDGFIYNLEQTMYFYYLNLKCTSVPWAGTSVFTYDTFKYFGVCLDLIKKGRNNIPKIDVKNFGWHFSYMGGSNQILDKITSFSHVDYYEKDPMTTEQIQSKIDNDIWIWNDGQDVRLTKVNIDETYPKYLLDNLDKFKHLIRS